MINKIEERPPLAAQVGICRQLQADLLLREPGSSNAEKLVTPLI